MRRIFLLFTLLSFIAVLLAACTGTATGSSSDSPNTVHMSDMAFQPTSITIKKGENVNLVNDVAAVHIIANGTWDNGTPRPKIEPGAPKVEAQVAGNSSQAVGPFKTAGTFNLYCTVHPNMNLTVIVQ